MDVAIHWQDAPPRLSGRYIPRLKSCCVVVMLVRAHRKNLEKRQKNTKFSHQPSIRLISPSYVRRSTSNVNVWCITAVDVGVLMTPLFAHTNFTSILQSQDEFVRHVKAIPRHAVDDHSQCDYHPLVVCSCGACENKDQIACQGKPYKTKFVLRVCSYFCTYGIVFLLVLPHLPFSLDIL